MKCKETANRACMQETYITMLVQISNKDKWQQFVLPFPLCFSLISPFVKVSDFMMTNVRGKQNTQFWTSERVILELVYEGGSLENRSKLELDSKRIIKRQSNVWVFPPSPLLCQKTEIFPTSLVGGRGSTVFEKLFANLKKKKLN